MILNFMLMEHIKTKEGHLRQKLASFKHGLRSKERILEAREVKKLIRSCKEILKINNCSPDL